ncbi:hypothetical protein GCM10023147_45000 [Tsukamurella soli]|uniref:Uncharacterized protein n=1 Tax=Tsukamurella soli TaxID=644556 RepID=A0ABP8KBQ0_9ACTN
MPKATTPHRFNTGHNTQGEPDGAILESMAEWPTSITPTTARSCTGRPSNTGRPPAAAGCAALHERAWAGAEDAAYRTQVGPIHDDIAAILDGPAGPVILEQLLAQHDLHAQWEDTAAGMDAATEATNTSSRGLRENRSAPRTPVTCARAPAHDGEVCATEPPG